MDYKKFNEMFDVDKLAEQVKELEENGNSSFDTVPVGEYEVKVTKMELSESKKGDPMVVIWFKILEGNFKNNYIFVNQVISKPYSIHTMNELLRELDSGIDVSFTGYDQYTDLLADIYEKIDGKLEYAIDYEEDKKGYKHITVEQVFEV